MNTQVLHVNNEQSSLVIMMIQASPSKGRITIAGILKENDINKSI